MGDLSKEPSMEEILSSIKRIIAEEGEEAMQAAPRRARGDTAFRAGFEQAPEAPADLEVLELTDDIAVEEIMPAPKSSRTARSTASSPVETPTQDQGAQGETILSVESEIAARQSLSALSSMLLPGKDGEDNTLEGLVRAMLKPMLKEWLDARLPALVEEMVAKEIARITSR
ncbi:MAG: DUF2497 domain-containing protein [Sphingobium sp.]